MKSLIFLGLLAGLITPVTGRTDLKITVIYDNYVHREGMESDWGFSCLIEGTSQSILFDTGTRGDLFMTNFRELGLSPAQVDRVVLSHEHGDHIGGLEAFLEARGSLPVYFPLSFSPRTVEAIKEWGGRPVPVKDPLKITTDLVLSGELGSRIPEIALGIRTSSGLVVVTGCSHPGIVEILRHFRETTGEPLLMALGGFHLRDRSIRQMATLIDDLRSLGLQKCAPTHCTGDQQIEALRQAFRDNYVRLGVGKVLTVKN